ncbi:MAG: rhomboid family intramembrane serine protease [Patescibacteria group bacterium]|nr:rhomboid family intramembrane serine protease [Patescibacteria group bacterium]
MLPLFDTTPIRRIPYVTVLIIFIVLVVFGIQLAQPDFDYFIHRWGLIPLLFNPEGRELVLTVTTLFLHANVFQVLSSVYFLWLFGVHVEDRLGHLAFLLYFLMAGFMALMLQMMLVRFTNLPLIGASGAITALAGTYLIYQFRSRLAIWLPVPGRFRNTYLAPSWIAILLWFATQFVVHAGKLGVVDYNIGGTAWYTHAGGLLFGVGMGLMFRAITREERTETPKPTSDTATSEAPPANHKTANHTEAIKSLPRKAHRAV